MCQLFCCFSVKYQCSGVLNNRTGSFRSPELPNKIKTGYPNDAECKWNITLPKDGEVNITFTLFDTEAWWVVTWLWLPVQWVFTHQKKSFNPPPFPSPQHRAKNNNKKRFQRTLACVTGSGERQAPIEGRLRKRTSATAWLAWRLHFPSCSTVQNYVKAHCILGMRSIHRVQHIEMFVIRLLNSWFFYKITSQNTAYWACAIYIVSNTLK